jgi:CRP-like cAMP-binding protein
MRISYKRNSPYCTCEDEFDTDAGDLLSIAVFSNIAKRCYVANDVICYEGDDIDKLCFIRSGNVRLLSYLPGGEARAVQLYAAGDWLGLEGLIGLPYEHTAKAVSEVDVACPVFCSKGGLRCLGI